MANKVDLNKLLEAAQEQSKNTGTSKNFKNNSSVTENIVSGSVDELDEMFNSSPSENFNLDLNDKTTAKKYSPEQEMDFIRNNSGYSNTNSKMPKQILESILNNPIDMSPLIEIQNGQQPVTIMTEDLQTRTTDIIEKLESRDRKGHPAANTYTEPKSSTNVSENSANQNIDVNQLTQIIETIIDNKLQQIKPMLTESRSISPKLNFMSIGDNFKFMDETGNVYECTMKYIGKGKIKK